MSSNKHSRLLCLFAIIFLCAQSSDATFGSLKRCFGLCNDHDKFESAFKLLNNHLDRSLNSNNPIGIKKNINRIIELQSTPNAVKSIANKSKANATILHEVVILLASLERILKPRIRCTNESYGILNSLEQLSKWRQHREAKNQGTNLEPVDALISHYAIEHANKCIPILVEKYKQERIDCESIENFLFEVGRYMKIYEDYKGLEYLNREYRLIYLAPGIVWPIEVDTRLGKFIADFLDLWVDDDVENNVVENKAKELFQGLIIDPCKHFVRENVEDIFNQFRADLRAYNTALYATSKDDPDGLNLLVGETISAQCKLILEYEQILEDSLIKSIELKVK